MGICTLFPPQFPSSQFDTLRIATIEQLHVAHETVLLSILGKGKNWTPEEAEAAAKVSVPAPTILSIVLANEVRIFIFESPKSSLTCLYPASVVLERTLTAEIHMAQDWKFSTVYGIQFWRTARSSMML
jgi:hypothetical protein